MATRSQHFTALQSLIMLKALCLFTFLASINFSDDSSMTSSSSRTRSRPLTSNHPQYVATHSSYRQLLGEFALFLQFNDQTVGIDVPAMATVDELYKLAAGTFQLNIGGIELSYQGKPLENRQEALADIGIGKECVVFVETKPNDIEYLLSTFEITEPSDTVQRLIQMIPQIHAANQELLKTGSQDIRAVVQLINSIADDSDYPNMRVWVNRVSSYVSEGETYGLKRIHGPPGMADIDEAAKVKTLDFDGLNDAVRFHWNRLPPHTVMLAICTGSVTSIDFRGIACDHLAHIRIAGMPELREVKLGGLERCPNLERLAVMLNKQLTHLDLGPLAGCGNLKELKLFSNALQTDLSLAPLREITSLRKLDLAGNAFGDRGDESFERVTAPLKGLEYLAIA